MKTLVLSMISIAATVAAMTACTSESDPIDVIDNGQPVEIKMNAGVITTKAPIESAADGKLTTALSNVHFYRIDGASPNWSTATPTSFTGTIETDLKITPSEKQYYPVNGDITTIAGLFVGDVTTTPPALTAGDADVIITGAEDIISATPVDFGDRKTPETTPLAFKHLLTQFKFLVKIDNVSITSAISNINIDVKDVNTSAKVTISDGTIKTWTTSKIISGATGLVTPADGTTSVASTGIMLEPDLTSITLVVKAIGLPTDGIEITIPGSDSGKFQQGKAYDITLTFKAKEIAGTATVAQWQTGTSTGGDVE